MVDEERVGLEEEEDDEGGAVVVIEAAEEAPLAEEEEEAEAPVRAPAAVLDTGRPAVPAAWRSLSSLELISQGLREADRRRR